MKKFDLDRAMSILANIGVIAGIVFLALEIQQNTDAIRSANIQALADQTYETVRLALENPDIREAFVAAQRNDMTDDQREIMNFLFAANLRIRQNRYLQAKFGILDEEVSSELGNGGVYRTAAFRQYWTESGTTYSPGFQEYVERVLLPLSDRPLSLFDQANE